MEDDEPISVMLQADKKKKKSKKKSESSPNKSLCCPLSPDQRDLQVICGLLDLQSTPDHPQEKKQKHEISTQQTSPQSSPVHERRSEQNSIAGAGRKRGRKCDEKHINSDHPNGNGCLQRFEGVLGHCEGLACQPNILQEKYASNQSYQNDAEEISSKDQIILSASRSKNKKMNTTATVFALCSNSDLHSGRERACQKISQDPRSHKKSNGQNEAGDLQPSIEGVRQLDGRELCTTSAEDNEIEPHCQWDKLSKKIETFASEANILQEICEDKANLGIVKCLMLDEEKRELIAQEMARSCQNDARLRHMFLESLNALVEGGLFQSVALKVLSEGPCEAAQEVIDRLEKRKTEPNSAQHLIALLHAFENARKSLRKMKGMVRLQALVGGNEVKKQAASTLQSMQSWIRIQAQVRARRSCMVAEARIKQQKREHQLKLEAELHDLEVDWLDGAETMEEILARVRQREEASLKRERAMAYAFSHQWRASSRTNHGYAGYEADKTNWGWSWMERWIAARPWENRLLAQSMKDGLENNVSNGRKYGNKHVKGVSVKKTVIPSIKTGQMNVKSSAKDVPSHNGSNSISDSKEHPNISENEAKKMPDLSNCEKPAMQKMNKSQPSMSQVVDATILAS